MSMLVFVEPSGDFKRHRTHEVHGRLSLDLISARLATQGTFPKENCTVYEPISSGKQTVLANTDTFIAVESDGLMQEFHRESVWAMDDETHMVSLNQGRTNIFLQEWNYADFLAWWSCLDA